MPATFAHCLIARKSIDQLMNAVGKMKSKKSPDFKVMALFAQILAKHNSFVVMGAAGPDYPYLTDILTTGVLQIGHTWANRMHYENVSLFVEEGVARLANMDMTSDSFSIKLSWFCGYVSHVIADSYVHPVVNSIVNGTYMFTHKEHSECELIQDIYIFNRETQEDIVSSNPRNGSLGFLKILDECSDQEDNDRIHPDINVFWTELLKATHPYASNYFDGIDPDKWHYNYKGRVNFIVDPGAIFRHVSGMTGFTYKKASDITQQERLKYIEKISQPNKKTDHYDKIFDKAVGKAVDVWLNIYLNIIQNNPSKVTDYVKNWNLDTGIDESRIDLWPMEG